MVPPECLHTCPLRHVPHTDALVLRVGQDELLAGMEDSAGHVVVMSPAGVQLPCLGLCVRDNAECIRHNNGDNRNATSTNKQTKTIAHNDIFILYSIRTHHSSSRS